MSVRIAINPLTWTNDDMPELGAETPLEKCLGEAKQAGYQGMELGNKFPRESQALAAALKPFGLVIASGWYSSRLLERSPAAEIEAMQAHFNLLRSQGCTAMVFAETSGCVHGDRSVGVSKRRVLQPAELEKLARDMTVVGDWLQARGMSLAYHHHMGTVIQTEAEIDSLMKHAGPSVKLLLDTGHLTYAGGNPTAVAERHAARIAHVHLKDIRAAVLSDMKAKDAPFLNAVLAGVFTVPGDGSVDYPSVFKVLKKANYAGWLVVEAEQDPKKAHPLTYAKMGYQYAHKLAVETGLLP